MTKRYWQATNEPKQNKMWSKDRADYDKQEWRRLRKLHLSEHPLCAECEKKGTVREATVVDHIIPVSRGGEFWDRSNLQSLCARCHNRKSARERNVTYKRTD